MTKNRKNRKNLKNHRFFKGNPRFPHSFGNGQKNTRKWNFVKELPFSTKKLTFSFILHSFFQPLGFKNECNIKDFLSFFSHHFFIVFWCGKKLKISPLIAFDKKTSAIYWKKAHSATLFQASSLRNSCQRLLKNTEKIEKIEKNCQYIALVFFCFCKNAKKHDFHEKP